MCTLCVYACLCVVRAEKKWGQCNGIQIQHITYACVVHNSIHWGNYCGSEACKTPNEEREIHWEHTQHTVVAIFICFLFRYDSIAVDHNHDENCGLINLYVCVSTERLRLLVCVRYVQFIHIEIERYMIYYERHVGCVLICTCCMCIYWNWRINC